MTNYEKIKNMSIGEMARHIDRLQDVEYTPYCRNDCEWAETYFFNIPNDECVKCAEKWLNKSASGGETDTNAINQDNLITNLRPEQVPAEILTEVTEMHKRFMEIYKDGYRVVNVTSSNGVQLSHEAFRHTFSDYKIESRGSEEYPIEISTEFNGVRVFAVMSKEEVQ